MSRQARIGLIVAALAVLAVAFVALAPGDDEQPRTATTTSEAPAATGTATAPDTGSSGGVEAPQANPQPAPAPTFEVVRVRASEPVGGVQKITVSKGDRARIEVTSSDTSDEVHLHGYDISKNLKVGGRVRFSFEADAEGIFELELEGAGAQIAQLVVEP